MRRRFRRPPRGSPRRAPSPRRRRPRTRRRSPRPVPLRWRRLTRAGSSPRRSRRSRRQSRRSRRPGRRGLRPPSPSRRCWLRAPPVPRSPRPLPRGRFALAPPRFRAVAAASSADAAISSTVAESVLISPGDRLQLLGLFGGAVAYLLDRACDLLAGVVDLVHARAHVTARVRDVAGERRDLPDRPAERGHEPVVVPDKLDVPILVGRQRSVVDRRGQVAVTRASRRVAEGVDERDSSSVVYASRFAAISSSDRRIAERARYIRRRARGVVELLCRQRLRLRGDGPEVALDLGERVHEAPDLVAGRCRPARCRRRLSHRPRRLRQPRPKRSRRRQSPAVGGATKSRRTMSSVL